MAQLHWIWKINYQHFISTKSEYLQTSSSLDLISELSTVKILQKESVQDSNVQSLKFRVLPVAYNVQDVQLFCL